MTGASQPKSSGDLPRRQQRLIARQPRRSHPRLTPARSGNRFLRNRPDADDRFNHVAHRDIQQQLFAWMIVGAQREFDSFPNASHPLFGSEVHLSDEVLPEVIFNADAGMNESAIASTRGLKVGPEIGERIIHREPLGRLGQSRYSAMAAPLVVFRFCDESGAYGIESHIAEQFEVVGVPVNENRLVTALATSFHDPASLDAVE